MQHASLDTRASSCFESCVLGFHKCIQLHAFKQTVLLRKHLFFCRTSIRIRLLCVAIVEQCNIAYALRHSQTASTSSKLPQNTITWNAWSRDVFTFKTFLRNRASKMQIERQTECRVRIKAATLDLSVPYVVLYLRLISAGVEVLCFSTAFLVIHF